MKKFLKKLFLIFPIFLVVFSLSGCKGDYKVNDGSKAQEQEKAISLDTSDWQTYRSEEYGFEVKFPKDWSVKEYKDLSGSFYKENSQVALIEITSKECSNNGHNSSQNANEVPCGREVLINVYDKESNIFIDPLHNPSVCNIGEIPSLSFVNRDSILVACQSFGAHTSVFHNYMLEATNFNYLLSTSYWNNSIKPRDYDWLTDTEKNKNYSYEEHLKFDLSIQQSILSSFRFI